MDNIRNCIDRMVRIDETIKELKTEYASLEAKILVRFTEDTQDTKHKSASYSADTGNVSAIESDTVKVIYPTMLKAIFGSVYTDMVKEDTSYTLTAPAKRLLAVMYKGDYITDINLEQAVAQLPVPDEKRKALAKKLKGRKYDSDKKNLMKIGGLSEKTAADYAYMLYEAANWSEFYNMCCAAGRASEQAIKKTIELINSAITVDTSPKVVLKRIDDGKE